MSESDFYLVVDHCVNRLLQGETLADNLAAYPDQAEALAPALGMAVDLVHLPRLEPAPAVVSLGFEQMMAALSEQNEPKKARLLAQWGGWFANLRPRWGSVPISIWRPAVVGLLLIVIGTSLVVTASATSLPGDALYPVKRSWENTRMTLTAGQAAKQALEADFMRSRLNELDALIDRRRPAVISFSGILLAREGDRLQVERFQVRLTEATAVSGTLIVGQTVNIRAQVQVDGTLVALSAAGVEWKLPATSLPTETPLPTRLPTATYTKTPTATSIPIQLLSPTTTPQPTDQPPAPTARPTRTLSVTPASSATPVPLVTYEPTATQHPADGPPRDGTSFPEPTPGEPPVDEATPTQPPSDEPPRDNTATPPPDPTATESPPEPTPTKERDGRPGDGSDQPP